MRKHLNDSVITSIKYSLINFHLDSRFISRISSSSSGSSKDEFFAWGAVEGPVNIRNWKKIQSGDYILCVFDNKYQYLSKILDKTINKELAAKIWGLNHEGKTWEYMYFFDKPVKVNIPLISLSNYMNAKYLGFTSISKEKLDKIVNDFSSIEVFLNKKLLNFKSSAKNITPKENSKTEINNVVQKKTFYKKFTNDDENSLSYVDMPNPTNNNSNSMEFHAQHTKMSTSFFDVQKRFRIPRYQRPYSWEKAQVEELWSDLLKHNRGTFFVGSVIFNKRREDDLGIIDIIDGQQRFLTLTILVRALLNKLSEFENDQDNLQFLKQNLRFISPDGDGWVRRLIPGKSLEEFFNDYVIDGERVHDDNTSTNITMSINEIKSTNENFQTKITKEELRVINTYNTFVNKLNEILKIVQPTLKKEIKSLINKRIRNLIIVEMKVLDENVAYEIFESTNARGLDLSIADLLKIIFLETLSKITILFFKLNHFGMKWLLILIQQEMSSKNL